MSRSEIQSIWLAAKAAFEEAWHSCPDSRNQLSFNHARNIVGQSIDRSNVVAHLLATPALACMVLATGGE